MSDLPEGPDWWRASDGKYYPPEARAASQDAPFHSNVDDERERGAKPDEAVVEEGAPVDEAAMASEPTFLDTPADEPSPTEPDLDPTPAPVINDDLYERDWPVDDEVEPEGRRLWPVLAVVAVIGLLTGLAIWFVLDDDGNGTGNGTGTGTTEVGNDTSSTEPDSTGTTSDPATSLPSDDATSPFNLAAGECFDAGSVADDGTELVNVRIVDCESPHQAEVVALEDLDASSDDAFPGETERDTAARELCTPIVESFLGGALAEASLLLLWLAPTEETWAEGDREVACVVAAPDGETLTGSAAGTLDGDDPGAEPDADEGSPDDPGSPDSSDEGDDAG